MKLSASVFAMVVIASAAAAAAHAAPAAAPQKALVVPVGEIRWSDNPAVPGARIAVLWGDPKKGGYGALKSIPAGTSVALHTHTQSQHVLTMEGTMVITIDSATKELAPGSYSLIPGGVAHAVECKAGADCHYFEEQAGPADIHFVTAPRK